MGLITKMYRQNFCKRYDFDDAIPFFCAADFAGLILEDGSFVNSSGVDVKYYVYYYEGYNPDKLVLFCPGLGPGHTAYLAEIDMLCHAGYKVLTLDYTGCGASGGERLPSTNQPTKDVMELLNLLKPTGEIIPVGHSLGGYTALNLAHLLQGVRRAVVISGFVDIADEMMGFVKLRPLANIVKRYERRLDPRYGALDNRTYLKDTTDKILWIHSSDDPVVDYRYNAAVVLASDNPNVRVLTVDGKKHNPQYSAEALSTMNAWIGEYYRKVRDKQLVTLEERKSYFADKPSAT